MNELPAPGDSAVDPGRRQLNRLRWGLRSAALIGMVMWGLYRVHVLQIPFREASLDPLFGAFLSLSIIEICFVMVLRLYDQSAADRKRLAAVAAKNALLLQEARQKIAEAASLSEVSHAIGAKLTQGDLLPYLAQSLARVVDGTSCLIALRNPRTGELELAAVHGSPFKDNQRHTLHEDMRPLAQAVIEAVQPFVVEDVLDSPYIGRRAAEGFPDKSLLGLPLVLQGRAIGAAIIGESRQRRRFSGPEVKRAMVVANQAAVAIANARLYASAQREREVAQTLLQIAGDLSGTLDLDEVLDLILERLRTVVPYESAAIALLAGDIYHLAAADDLARAKRLWGTSLSSDDLPLVARAVRGRSAVIVADTHQSDDWVVAEGGEHIRSWLGVPLVVKDRTIGLLMLSHPTPAFYGQQAGRLALAFAQQAAVAIENARLYEQTRAKLREQTSLYEMTTAVSSTLDAGRVLRLLAEQLVTMLGVTSTRIATLDDEQKATFVAQGYSADANAAEETSSIGEVCALATFPIATEALSERQPLLVTAEDAPEEWRERMAGRSGRTMLLLPLVARNRVTGFVELWDSRSQRRFTEVEMALAQTLINQAAVAVDNARLFAETQRRLSELTLLYDMAVAATSTLDLDAILQSVVKTLQFRVLEGAAVSVLLLDRDQRQLRLRAHAGELQEMTSQKLLALTEELGSQVLRDGQPILIGDTRQDPPRASCSPAVRSILCVPLAWGQRVVGVLQALSAQESAFSSHDLRLLRTMAGSLAIAIENVRLIGALKRSEEALLLRNQALERANERLQELDRLKSAFIASVSHELRTPLNSIIGFSEVLIDGLAGELPPLAREYLGYVHTSGKHLSDLINDILDLSKIQAGRMTLELAQVDVMAVVEEVRATLAPLVAKKEQTLSVAQDGPLPTIRADRFRLKQILLNLMGNANKFTQEGGQVTVRALMADPVTLQLDVVDNGPGIPLEDQGLIFEEFKQARAARPPGEGTGLGLAITRRLVELHGGRVWVQSKLGAGSTFSLLLPVAGPDPDESNEDTSEAAPGEE